MPDDGTKLLENCNRYSGLAFVAILLALFAAYSGNLEAPTPNRSMEKFCMVTSQETWLRQRSGESNAWQTPSIAGGIPRVRKPPLLVWLNMLAWSDLEPQVASIEALAWRARLVTILLALLGVAATGWVGWQFAGPRGGLLATLVTGSMYTVVKHTHYTLYDTHMMGWTALSVACGVWAMQPHRPCRWRPWNFAGWLGSGLTLGAAVMTKGPVALVYTALPLIWMIGVTPKNRQRNILGFMGMLAVCSVPAAWWYHHILAVKSGSMSQLTSEYNGMDSDQWRPIWQYAMVFGLVFPWTIWWGAAVVQPLRNRIIRQDPRVWLTWGWFVTSFVFTAAWPMRNERYLVPCMPGAGALTAMWLTAMAERCSEPPTWIRHCWQGTWILLGIVSLGFPVAAALEPILLAKGLVHGRIMGQIGWPLTVASTVGLVALVYAGARTRQRDLTTPPFILGLWFVLLIGVTYYGYNGNARNEYKHQAAAERFFELTQGNPVYYAEGKKGSLPQPLNGFRIYSRRIIRPMGLATATTKLNAGIPFRIMVNPDSHAERTLLRLGMVVRMRFRDDRNEWVLLASPPTTDRQKITEPNPAP